jgi:hypothetical protein
MCPKSTWEPAGSETVKMMMLHKVSLLWRYSPCISDDPCVVGDPVVPEPYNRAYVEYTAVTGPTSSLGGGDLAAEARPFVARATSTATTRPSLSACQSPSGM